MLVKTANVEFVPAVPPVAYQPATIVCPNPNGGAGIGGSGANSGSDPNFGNENGNENGGGSDPPVPPGTPPCTNITVTTGANGCATVNACGETTTVCP